MTIISSDFRKVPGRQIVKLFTGNKFRVSYIYDIGVQCGIIWPSQVVLMVKNTPANAGDLRGEGSSLGWEDPLEEGMATPLQYSYLENPMARGTWWGSSP